MGVPKICSENSDTQEKTLPYTKSLPQNQDILPHKSGFALDPSRLGLQTRKQRGNFTENR
jgi:hypothetical protein